ncbi:DUF4301 family protein [Gillisia limnaea]|uniref:DUF4301 domain-containing protein n=1 Tax=Gillisia limnaea (strain DSM 15749 / LMG 21470 / R-8282) TaxID=865937 RepID=H2BRY1_GILLR|nr:DUF4301 family protein [Gillisia limnaea]EHQ02468.1 hypothetical protein Gilli_1826 [Gillisia limnaea DSM 15749]
MISREKDLKQIDAKGLTREKVEEQLRIFERGNISVNILAAATAGDGIQQFSESQKNELVEYYDANKFGLNITKFIPASGAATRMFKDLHEFLEEFDAEKESISDFLSNSKNENLKRFFSQMEKLPFYKRALNNARESQPGFNSLSNDAKNFILIRTMLHSPGLNLSDYPKGLVPFHDYGDHVATAFEEHVFEASKYAAIDGVVKLHFTVSEKHKEKFEAEFESIKKRVAQKAQVKFEVTYSYQNPQTDTIAADDSNKPFRTEEGTLFFRPGGHGALIDNLNELKAAIVFIKNIDNVVIGTQLEEVAKYKKVLAGKLLKLQERCFKFLKELEAENASGAPIEKISEFLKNELFLKFKSGFDQLSEEEKLQYLKEKLNRPLRVCGMVKNEGEPGGGPFLVKMENGESSLQIIEGAQIDKNNPDQKKIAENATHFNPVDIVCGLKNYLGISFDLNEFVDPSTSFIAEKDKDGKPLKALELPGLWNGAMAKWNTVFVEVPVTTFNPVKTVSDLLKPSHQVK